MTKGTDEYKGIQSCFTCISWQEADNEIQKDYKEGRAVTGICYSTGVGQYFIVMTETPQGQTYKWFDDTTVRRNWMDVKYKEGFHPTIIFKDPTDKKTLVVMSTDNNRSGYVYVANHKVE